MPAPQTPLTWLLAPNKPTAVALDRSDTSVPNVMNTGQPILNRPTETVARPTTDHI